MDQLTAFGLFAVTAMVVCYALENRSRWYVLGFAASCLLGSAYGFLQGAWPFGLVEAIWSIIAFRRFWKTRVRQQAVSGSPASTTDFGPCFFCGQPLRQDRQRKYDIEELLDLMVRSRLATDEEATEYLSRYREECLKATGLPDTVTAFCTFLVTSDILTTWQIWKLRNGQWKGFCLDDFVLLDFHGKNHEYCYYLARDTKNDTFVVLEITPMARTKGPDIEYRVSHRFEERQR